MIKEILIILSLEFILFLIYALYRIGKANLDFVKHCKKYPNRRFILR